MLTPTAPPGHGCHRSRDIGITASMSADTGTSIARRSARMTAAARSAPGQRRPVRRGTRPRRAGGGDRLGSGAAIATAEERPTRSQQQRLIRLVRLAKARPRCACYRHDRHAVSGAPRAGRIRTAISGASHRVRIRRRVPDLAVYVNHDHVSPPVVTTGIYCRRGARRGRWRRTFQTLTIRRRPKPRVPGVLRCVPTG